MHRLLFSFLLVSVSVCFAFEVPELGDDNFDTQLEDRDVALVSLIITLVISGSN